jgi:hypothetical protein
VIVAFALVALQSFRNRIMSQLRRLRNPRYLIGAVAGAIYFYFVFLRRSAQHGFRGTDAVPLAYSGLRIDFIAFIVLALAILAWAVPSDGGGVEFTESEIAFLFPAPLTRPQLLLYKGLRAQPQVLTTSIIVGLFALRSTHFFGVWAFFTIASIYTTMVSQGRARLRLAGVNFIARLIAVAAILSALVMYAIHEVRQVVDPSMLKKGAQFAPAIERLFDRPVPAALLFLPKLFVNAMYPSSTLVMFRSIAAIAVLGALFAFLAGKFVVSFEEASIVASKRKLDRVQLRGAQRSGRHIMFRRMRAPFLAPTGLPDIAIVWKNVVALLRISSGWAMALMIMLVAQYSIALSLHEQTVYTGIGMVLAMISALFPLIGPTAFANDLRLDLSRFEVLKSYPISGERLVAAEIAAPLVVISIFELLFITSAAVMLSLGAGAIDVRLNFFTSARFIITALLVAVPICAMQLVLRNSVPIFFPAWAGRSKEDPRGIAFAGQRLVVLLGNLVALAVTLIPAAIVFLPSLWVAVHWFAGHPISIAIATLPAIATIVAEIWMAIHFLGERFDELDLSNEIDVVEFA